MLCITHVRQTRYVISHGTGVYWRRHSLHLSKLLLGPHLGQRDAEEQTGVLTAARKVEYPLGASPLTDNLQT